MMLYGLGMIQLCLRYCIFFLPNYINELIALSARVCNTLEQVHPSSLSVVMESEPLV